MFCQITELLPMLTFLSIEISSLSLQAMRLSCSTFSTKGLVLAHIVILILELVTHFHVTTWLATFSSGLVTVVSRGSLALASNKFPCGHAIAINIMKMIDKLPKESPTIFVDLRKIK
jgi:hypothetical protein